MTRWPWLVLLLAGLIAVSYIGGKHSVKTTTAPVDSVRVVIMHDTIRRIDSVERVKLVYRTRWIKTAPIDSVIADLPTDTADTIPPVLVPDGTIRATADSLATCQHDRDSLTRANLLERERTRAQDEARRLCESKPAPAREDPPSRLAWLAGGTLAGIVTTIAIIITATRYQNANR